jgi:uncharacterized paraquat-inducible protein A
MENKTLGSAVRWGMFFINILLLIGLPIAWYLPLMRISLPMFSSSEISLARGAVELFQHDKILFYVIFIFGMIIPFLKIMLYLYIWLKPYRAVKPTILLIGSLMAKLSMADIFISANWFVIYKINNLMRVSILEGMYVFTGVVVVSLFVSAFTHFWFKRINVVRINSLEEAA